MIFNYIEINLLSFHPNILDKARMNKSFIYFFRSKNKFDKQRPFD